MDRRTATAIPPQFHVGVEYVRAKGRGSALNNASSYLRRARESDVRDRCAITDVRSYAQRLEQHAAARAEVTGYATFGGGPATAKDIWDRVDKLARRKDGKYHRRAGGRPRLAILADMSIPWDLPEDEKVRVAHEMAKSIADRYDTFVEVVCHIKQDHPERGIDHAHCLISMRKVDGDGVVGEMNRDLNGMCSRRSDTRVVLNNRTLSAHIVFMRSRWARLLSEATGLDYDWRSYADQGLDLEPVKDHSREEIEVDRRVGGPLMAERAAFVQTRNAAFLRRRSKQAEARSTPAARPQDLATKLATMDPRLAPLSSFNPMALLALQAAIAKRVPCREGKAPGDYGHPQRQSRHQHRRGSDHRRRGRTASLRRTAADPLCSGRAGEPRDPQGGL